MSFGEIRGNRFDSGGQTKLSDDSRAQSGPRHQVYVEAVAPLADWPAGFPRPDRIARRAETALVYLAAWDRLDVAISPGGGGPCAYGVNIIIQNDSGIARINREQRQKDRPTDVLSFPMFDFPAGPGTADIDLRDLRNILNAWPAPGDGVYHIGDVVISHESCARQAVEIGHTVGDEFQRLLVHGILHLFGYDHETSAADERRMREREDRLLSALD